MTGDCVGRSYRARTLLSLHEKEPEKDYLDKELDLMDSLVKAHLKSYQIWCAVVWQLYSPLRTRLISSLE